MAEDLKAKVVGNESFQCKGNVLNDICEKIKGYQIKLIISADSTDNQKELELIDKIDYLLFQAEKGMPLNQDKLSNVRYKISRVSCFSENYGAIIFFLEDYQKLI
ncbi:MAG: hypothetical protein ISS23_01715 [Nanoarchaeota archaeon]|nr:hypothetical protein [Nanoarchaeota archaeon]